jgi:type IV secretory pathway component VirB8
MFRLIYIHHQADGENKNNIFTAVLEVLRYRTFANILHIIYLQPLKQLRTFYYRDQPDGDYILTEICSWLY